jgi:aryl-alcohol dehydrogenase-like predicted oxidoreductase
MPQVALNWLLCRPGVTAPIIGARNLDQLSENLGSAGWSLSQDRIATLDSASEPDVTYPYDSRAEEQQRAGRELE